MKEILPSGRSTKVTYAIRDIVVKAQALEQQGKRVLYLNIGDPPVYDFDTPQHIKEFLKKKIDEDASDAHHKVSRYADSMGLKSARDAIAAHLRRERGLAVSTDDIAVTAGASEGIMLAIAALVNPGENLLVPCPGYPLYDSTLALYHGEPNYYALDEQNDWQVDFKDLERKIDAKTRGIVVINPNNPTGAVYTEETLRKILAFAKKHELVVFADEIYDQLLIDKEYKHHGLAALAADVPVLAFGGLSKNYVMPGYRVGWLHFHDPTKKMPKLIGAIKQLLRSRLSAPHLQQHAVSAALNGDHAFQKEFLLRLKAKRDVTVEKLNAIPGISVVPPRGAFYAFARVQLPPGQTDKAFVEQLLEEEHVVVVYGSGFGLQEYEEHGVRYGHFRVVFLAKPDTLAHAYDKIAAFTKRYYEKHHYTPK